MYWDGYVMSVVEKKFNASLIHWEFVCVGLHIQTSSTSLDTSETSKIEKVNISVYSLVLVQMGMFSLSLFFFFFYYCQKNETIF